MKKNKEIWINEVLDSTMGIQRAKPGEFLFPKILNKIKNPVFGEVYISKKKVVLGFLTILLLGLLNAGAIFFNKDNGEYKGSTKSVVEEYFPSKSYSLDQIFNQ